MDALDIEIDIKDIKAFVQFVKKEFDYDFTNYAFSSLKRRLQRLLSKYQIKDIYEFQELIHLKKISIEEVAEGITVNTTEMFRDPSLWKKLKDSIIPELLSKTNGSIRIWHAACSSGEEVYSMAILLKELGCYENAQIIATDINEKVISKAKRGIYSKQNLELNLANYSNYQDPAKNNFAKYYQDIDAYTLQLDTSLLSNVSFQKYDLVKGGELDSFDLILLRNVMIYFNFELQERVISLVNSKLAKAGVLILGSKETIAWSKSASAFTLLDTEDKIYRKRNS